MEINITSLVKSAINLFDPAACMECDYEQQVDTLTQLVTKVQQDDPYLAMSLDPQTLANLLETAHRTESDITEVFHEFAQEHCAIPA